MKKEFKYFIVIVISLIVVVLYSLASQGMLIWHPPYPVLDWEYELLKKPINPLNVFIRECNFKTIHYVVNPCPVIEEPINTFYFEYAQIDDRGEKNIIRKNITKKLINETAQQGANLILLDSHKFL